MRPPSIATRAALAALIVTLATLASAEISVDYDPEGKVGAYSTYAFRLDGGETLEEVNPTLHRQILDQLREKLADVELREVSTDPQLWVLYKVAVEEAIAMHTTYDYDYGDGWVRWGYGPSWGTEMGQPTTRETTYTKGTLVVDVWDRESNRLVWRGIATDAVADKPKVNARRVRKAINGMAKRWQQIRSRALAER